LSSTEPLLPPRYASRVAFTGVANGVVSALCAAFALPLLVSVLGMDRYADWAALGMFITLGAALDLGMSRAIVVTCAGQPAARVRECASAAALIAGSLALLGTAVALALSLTTGRLLGFAPAGFSNAVLFGGCAILVLGMANGVMRAVLESQMAAHWINAGYLAQTLLYYVLSLLAAHFWPAGVVPATVTALACVAGMHAAWLMRARLWRPVWPQPATWREMGRIARQSYLLAAPPALLPPLAALLVLATVADRATFATYDIAFRVATLASTLLASIAVPMLAASARAHATGSGAARLDQEVRRYLKLGWSLFLAGALAFWLLDPWLLDALFPGAGEDLFPVALLLLAGMGAISASEAVTRTLLGGQDPAPVLLSRMLMLTVVLGAGIAMLYRDGITAFAAVYAVAGISSTALLLFTWFRRQRFSS
jgi:hypothetical protein